MNYEKIIVELGSKIGQLSIDNAVLATKVQEEQEAKEAIEKQYIEVCTELRSVKEQAGIVDTQEVIINE